jgi:predicted NBD/HSP70 family sugar kinase
MARQELAEQTGLSAGTVTNVINGLLDEGLVVEAGTEGSDGGRPRILLEIAKDRGIAVGVDVGETRVRVEAFDLGLGKIAAVDRLVHDGCRDPQVMVGLIVEALEAVLVEAGAERSALAGVGVGVSGIVDGGGDGLVHSASLGWQNVPFASLLRETIEAPVRVDNGAKTMGQAEMWFGAGRAARNAAVVLLGTGVGAAVFTDGRLYRGSHSSAGEWGHTPIMVGGRSCRCGSRGCLEAYVGGGAIAERWVGTAGAAPSDQEAAVEAFGRAIGTDDVAAALADELAEYLGAGLATLVNLFNPERIVIAGWVGLQLGPALLDRVRVQTASYALQRPFEQVDIVLGALGTDAVALGAATLVIDGILAGELPTSGRGRRQDRADPQAVQV